MHLDELESLNLLGVLIKFSNNRKAPSRCAGAVGDGDGSGGGGGNGGAAAADAVTVTVSELIDSPAGLLSTAIDISAFDFWRRDLRSLEILQNKKKNIGRRCVYAS